MREKFSGNRLGWAYRRPATGPGSGRIRYAHGGAPPRVEPHCTASQGGPPWPADHHAADAGGAADLRGDVGTPSWLAEPPVGGRADLWVLVCGGIAAAAAFAAAFVASGGVASHPATPGATMPAVVSHAAAPGSMMPAVVSQACPALSPGPGPAAVPTP
jgi:hypothetical protein